jgi:hypothetical protein
MNKINLFFKEHGSKIITALLILLYLKSCSIDNEVNKLKREVKETSAKTLELVRSLPTTNDLKIEGLNAEKRMIQATDRKIFDVQRQNEIEKEIKILEGK